MNRLKTPVGIADQTDDDLIAELPQQPPNQGGFSGPDIAGQQGKCRLRFQAVLEHGQRHGVLARRIEELGIRRQRERFELETEVALVHDGLSITRRHIRGAVQDGPHEWSFVQQLDRAHQIIAASTALRGDNQSAFDQGRKRERVIGAQYGRQIEY
jgi:hypothetical protein